MPTPHPRGQAGAPGKLQWELSLLGTLMERKQKATETQQKKAAHTEMSLPAIADLRSL